MIHSARESYLSTSPTFPNAHAVSCFYKANVCKKMISNCVCSQPKPDCSFSTTTCKSIGVNLYDAWYKMFCEHNLRTMATSAPSLSATGPSMPTSTGSPGRKGLSKGAIAGVGIGAVARALALGLFQYYCLGPRAPSSDGAATAPPDRHEMEGSSNPNAGPDLIQSIMPSMSLIEVLGDSR